MKLNNAKKYIKVMKKKNHGSLFQIKLKILRYKRFRKHKVCRSSLMAKRKQMGGTINMKPITHYVIFCTHRIMGRGLNIYTARTVIVTILHSVKTGFIEIGTKKKKKL